MSMQWSALCSQIKLFIASICLLVITSAYSEVLLNSNYNTGDGIVTVGVEECPIRQYVRNEFALKSKLKLTKWEAETSITIATHLSFGGLKKREKRLVELCESWRGPISASVLFIHPSRDLPRFIEFVKDNQCLQQYVDIHIVFNNTNPPDSYLSPSLIPLPPFDSYHVSNSSQAQTHSTDYTIEENMFQFDYDYEDREYQIGVNLEMQLWYPFNVMRNVAMINAKRTRFAFPIDIDFYVFPQSHSSLRPQILPEFFSRDYSETSSIVDEWGKHWNLVEKRKILIAPAFETFDRNATLPLNKEELLAMVDRNEAEIFALVACKSCHFPVNFEKWRTTRTTYKIKPSNIMEPYAIMDRTSIPKYDERFIGRNFNKISFYLSLQVYGFEFWVLPDAFVVHLGPGDRPDRPHTEAFSAHDKSSITAWNSFVLNLQNLMGNERRR